MNFNEKNYFSLTSQMRTEYHNIHSPKNETTQNSCYFYFVRSTISLPRSYITMLSSRLLSSFVFLVLLLFLINFVVVLAIGINDRALSSSLLRLLYFYQSIPQLGLCSEKL